MKLGLKNILTLQVFDRFNYHKYNIKTNLSSQTAFSKFVNKNKNNITEIKWSTTYKARQNVPKKSDNSSI